LHQSMIIFNVRIVYFFEDFDMRESRSWTRGTPQISSSRFRNDRFLLGIHTFPLSRTGYNWVVPWSFTSTLPVINTFNFSNPVVHIETVTHYFVKFQTSLRSICINLFIPRGIVFASLSIKRWHKVLKAPMFRLPLNPSLDTKNPTKVTISRQFTHLQKNFLYTLHFFIA
jgi:hypothetical protein